MKEPIIRTHNREIDDLFERYRRAPGSHVFAPLADAYRKLGLIEEALDICARGLSANPRYASGYVVQGKCQYDAGRADRAEESFKKVLELDRNNLVALRYLGIIRAGCGDTDGAREYFEQILTLDPGDKEIRQRLDGVRETTAPADRLVEEIEQVLQPEMQRGLAPVSKSEPAPKSEPKPVAPTIERIEIRPAAVEEPIHAPVVARSNDVIDLPEVRDEFEGSPILLGRDESVTTEYIATVTLADIFASQGYSEKALKIYRDVLRRQPNNEDVSRKIAAIERGEPITRASEIAYEPASERGTEPEQDTRPLAPTAPSPLPETESFPPIPSSQSAPPGVAVPAANATIDEGRSYEQFKRWLRTVSD